MYMYDTPCSNAIHSMKYCGIILFIFNTCMLFILNKTCKILSLYNYTYMYMYMYFEQVLSIESFLGHVNSL